MAHIICPDMISTKAPLQCLADYQEQEPCTDTHMNHYTMYDHFIRIYDWKEHCSSFEVAKSSSNHNNLWKFIQGVVFSVLENAEMLTKTWLNTNLLWNGVFLSPELCAKANLTWETTYPN